MTTPEIKPGDILAYKDNYGRETCIALVEGITRSGRIVAGAYTLNPDLTVRGRAGLYGPHRMWLATLDDIREARTRQLAARLTNLSWLSMPPETVHAVAALVWPNDTTTTP